MTKHLAGIWARATICAVILFHRTTAENARRILAAGFRDRAGTYMTDQMWSGVWVSNVPLDANEGMRGDALLRVCLDPSVNIGDFEWIEEGRLYREWLVPAHLLNEGGTVEQVDEDEV